MLNAITDGITSVEANGCHVRPINSSALSQASLTHAWRKRRLVVVAVRWVALAVKSYSIYPEVVAPNASGPVIANLSLEAADKNEKFGIAFKSSPLLSFASGKGNNNTIPSIASTFFRVSKIKLFMIKPDILTSTGLIFFS